MRHEWLFGARSRDSRSSCERPDPFRLPGKATDAFVDRVAIDWRALLRRAHLASDRAFLENLQWLDAIRASPPPPAETSASSGRVRALRVATVLAALQTICCLLAVGTAVLARADLSDRLPQIGSAIAFAGASLLLALRAPHDLNSIRLLAAFAAGGSAFGRSAIAALPTSFVTFPVALRGLYPEAFVPAALWELAIGFPRVSRFTSFDIMARRAARAAWVVGLTLFGLNAVAAYRIDIGVAAALMRGDPGNLFWHIFVIASIPALTAIFVRSRMAPLIERRKVARFAAGIALGTGPLLLSGIVRMAIPAFDAWMAHPGAWARAWLDRAFLGALMAMPIACGVAVLEDRPFDLQPWNVWRLLNAFGLMASRIPLDRPDRMTTALQRLRVARGSRELVVALEREIRQSVRASAAHVLTIDTPGRALRDPRGRLEPLSAGSAMAAILAETTEPLDLNDRQLRTLLPAADLEWVHRNGATLIGPIKRRDGGLMGLVVLGRKRGRQGFDRRDQSLVTMLTTAAATIWNAGETAGHGSTRPDATVDDARGDVAYECSRCGAIVATMPLRCACAAVPGLAALPALLADRFVVERRIGSGAMGVVYLARDADLDRRVALKTLPDLRVDAVSRLRAEARAMARLNHDAVATLYGLEWWRRTPVLVVEYFDRGTLGDVLVSEGLSEDAVVALGIRLARALDHMHRLGVLHRDLKPSNIGITAEGTPKLLDLGLAALIDPSPPSGTAEHRQRHRRCAGTPAYLPPEAFSGATPGPAFDLWALSIVLAEALSGMPPGQRGRAWRRAVAAHEGPLKTFFSQALAVDPARRFATARELLHALETIGSEA